MKVTHLSNPIHALMTPTKYVIRKSGEMMENELEGLNALGTGYKLGFRPRMGCIWAQEPKPKSSQAGLQPNQNPACPMDLPSVF